MLFSHLITELQKGSAGLKSHLISRDPELSGAASLDQAKNEQISFLEKGNLLTSKLDQTNAGAVLLPLDDQLCEIATIRGLDWACFSDPRLAFAETLELLNPKILPKPGIHSTAVIGNGVEIGKDVYIGPHVSIGDTCLIGAKSVIHPGVVIYENVSIGEQTELHANCVLHQQSKLGNKCVIHSNAVIGSEGFGFVPYQGTWKKMPQTGVVIIEDEVEIGCNSTIDRPAVGETRISYGTKIDNLVQIGHGVSIGENCAMASQVGIAGGAKLGNGVILAGQVGVGNRVKVGDRVIASSKCGIHADVEPGQVISGFPALPNKLWLRCSANFKRLPEIAKNLRELDRRKTN